MVEGIEIKTAFAGFRGEKMRRAWRNRSPVTQSYWFIRAQAVLGPLASVADVHRLAAALYVACGNFTWTDDSFRPDTLAMTAWEWIAEQTHANRANLPEKALSRGEYCRKIAESA